MSISADKPVIGFIGTGVMGRSMAGHLLRAGHPLHVHTRTRERAQELLSAGAIWQEAPGPLARAADIVISMVGYPKDVEDIYLGTGGVVASARPDTLLIDMTTSSPLLAAKVHAEAKRHGLGCLDAPVSGGDIGAREARLSIMAGGDKADFDRALPVFQVIGRNIVYQGPAGSGQHTKMANQIAIAAGMIGVCEALAYAKAAGLDQQAVLQSISGGAAGSWSLANLAPRMIAGDFAPGFYVKHFIKDMGIALESAQEMGLDTPGLALAKALYEKLAAQGGADLGTQALYRLYCAHESGLQARFS